MLTESRRSLTFVDVLEKKLRLRFEIRTFQDILSIQIARRPHLADTGGSPNVFETLPAQALVGADAVLAAAVQSADVTTVDAAFVDVNAVVVRSGRVTGRADAVVSTLPVLAGLALAAFVRSLSTLVYVDAVLPGHGVQSVTGPADHPGRASVKFLRIQSLLLCRAAILRAYL